MLQADTSEKRKLVDDGQNILFLFKRFWMLLAYAFNTKHMYERV